MNRDNLAKECWKLYDDMFKNQRDVIVWASQFITTEKDKHLYNVKVNEINSILERLKFLMKKLTEAE